MYNVGYKSDPVRASSPTLEFRREMMMQTHWEHRLLDLAGELPDPTAEPVYSYWAGDASLQLAYATCDRITRQHSKSFYLASALLPEEKRSAVRALYAFCRTVDDVVDAPEESQAEAKLAYWTRIIQGHDAPASDRVARAWLDAIRRYDIPRNYALQLIDGVARDLTQTRYQSFSELATYCYGVASTVGLMSMYIVGYRSSQALPYAIKLGVALQLTNILRDVSEDFSNGHIYLPQDELAEFGLTEADIQAGTVSEAWREFMCFQIERTRGLYREAWGGIRLLNRDGQMAIAAAADFYQAILAQIEAQDYDTFSRRAGLSAWQKLSRIPSLWWRLHRP